MARTTSHVADIEAELRYLERECAALSGIRARWNDLDAAEREAFDLEWFGHANVTLNELRALRDGRGLSPNQSASLQAVEETIADHASFLQEVAAER